MLEVRTYDSLCAHLIFPPVFIFMNLLTSKTFLFHINNKRIRNLPYKALRRL